MNWLRNLALSLCLVCALPAAAASPVNVGDHWWAEGESGWGLSITQQEDVAFVALYFYGADRQPTWYTATGLRYGTDASGNPGFSGALYKTTGPYHGGAFDPVQVQATPVGNLVFQATSPTTAQLAYDVNGVSVTKVVTRFTFRTKNWTGLYRAVQRANYRDCVAGFTPAFTYDDGLIDVEHDGSEFRMWFEGKKQTCMYTGSYQQVGRLGIVSGTYSCADGPSGTFSLRGLETHEKALGGEIDMTHPACGYVQQELAGFRLD